MSAVWIFFLKRGRSGTCVVPCLSTGKKKFKMRHIHKPLIPGEVGEGTVGLGHFMTILTLFHSGTGAVVGIHQF